jgi:hypothetical protein
MEPASHAAATGAFDVKRRGTCDVAACLLPIAHKDIPRSGYSFLPRSASHAAGPVLSVPLRGALIYDALQLSRVYALEMMQNPRSTAVWPGSVVNSLLKGWPLPSIMVSCELTAVPALLLLVQAGA